MYFASMGAKTTDSSILIEVQKTQKYGGSTHFTMSDIKMPAVQCNNLVEYLYCSPCPSRPEAASPPPSRPKALR